MKKKLFVLSMDAMVHEDVALMMKKPNFARIMAKRAEVNGVKSVYPASTYPAHSTLITGCMPAKHGIWANFPFYPINDDIAHWPVYHSMIDVEDLFAAAKRAGCTTASVYWPIMGCNPNIDHIINEYFFYYPGERDNVEPIFKRMGADEIALQAVRENDHLFPHAGGTFDNFINGCTCSLIRSVQPDVLLVHNCWLDSNRHADGVFGQKVIDALDDMDNWLGDIIAAMEDAGVYEDTDFVILSDHGQRDYTRIVNFNALLKQGGLIEQAPDGTIYNWRAYAKSNGFSSTVYLANPHSEKLYNRVKEYLYALAENKEWGIEKVYTKEEVYEKYGQGGSYSFMIEAVEGTYFTSCWTGEVVTQLDVAKAGHGYEPEKGPQPVFLATGPSFKEGAVLETANLMDVAPTLAATLGQTLPQAEGRVLTELLK